MKIRSAVLPMQRFSLCAASLVLLLLCAGVILATAASCCCAMSFISNDALFPDFLPHLKLCFYFLFPG